VLARARCSSRPGRSAILNRMTCPRCGRPLERANCPTCAPGSYVITAESGNYGLTGHPIGTVVESPPDHPVGRRVEYRPASGGQAVSDTDSAGSFTADLSGPLERGKSNEERVMEVLAAALKQQGHEVSRKRGARDEDGEDGLLVIDGRQTETQIVTMPVDPEVWEMLNAYGASSRTGDLRAQVGLIRGALKHKAYKAKGALVALDATHFGALVGRALVDVYLAEYRSPVEEFSFLHVWIIGPTVRSSVRLG
jgi:hypothetical protein